MKFNTLTFEQQVSVGILTINRPEALNALNKEVFRNLDSFCDGVEQLDIRCLIITGAGTKAFVVGADIREMTDQTENYGLRMSQHGQETFQRIENLPVPVIAAVNGFALGGGLELALACDFIIASNQARFGLPEVSLGLIPGYGGTQRLARNIGKSNARMMVLTGDVFSAQQAVDWGLVSKLVEPDALLEVAVKQATQISLRSRTALQWGRQAINQGYDQTLSDGLALESELFQCAYNSADKQEGVTAFIEKRTPKFK